MSGLPLLIAARGFVPGPKVPVRPGTIGVEVLGLVAPGYVLLYGLKAGYESVELGRIEQDGKFNLYPDDHSGCEEMWAELHCEVTEGVYVWVR